MAARTIIGFIRECRDRGKTVIFSTHVMSEVEKLCDSIGIIHGGRLLAGGTLADLREQFGNRTWKISSSRLWNSEPSKHRHRVSQGIDRFVAVTDEL